MEIKDLILLNESDFDVEQKEIAYNVLSNTKIDEFPRRNIRKILEICLIILRYKGEQVVSIQEQFEAKSQGETGGDDSIDGKLLEENEKLKRTLTKLEAEKLSLKVKIDEMNDEIDHLQRRLQEMNTAESDKDSSDPLSELDRHEELLKNISTKNKHIKRLLRDIEDLQKQNVQQSKIIIELEGKLQQSNLDFKEISDELAVSKSREKELNGTIEELNKEISRLEGNITYLEDEREKSEEELKEFIQKLEERAFAWRCTIDEKEDQLESLRKKYEELYEKTPSVLAAEYGQEAEVKKLFELLQEKDHIIEELENKLKNMAEEMVASTKLMNKISTERELEKSQMIIKKRSCCKDLEEALLAANSRCKELSEMLETVEEDNILKAKQAINAIRALEAYQRGEDGLPQSLRKISQLEQKLNSRDRQIKALVMEVNSLHDIAQENILLRKKLNIPEDAIISTTNLLAKQKSKDKMLDRLNLKLRASEEMRLQLKIECTELKQKLIHMQKQRIPTAEQEDVKTSIAPEGSTKDIGSVRPKIYCDNCLRNIQSIPNQKTVVEDVINEWEAKYSSVIEENENLRVGMHEILEKIRDYDASSDHITIDCTILEKVIHALDARSISGWYHPAMRMQNELIAVKEREQALREQVNLIEKVKLVEQELKEIKGADIANKKKSSLSSSTEPEHKSPIIREQQEQPFSESIEEERPSPSIEKFSLQSEDLYTVLAEKDAETMSARSQLSATAGKYREILLDNEKLKIFKIQFEELSEKLKSNSENDITKYCAELVDKVTEKEIQINLQNKKYEFLKEDFDQTLTDYKNSETKNILLIADLKKQLNDKKHELNLQKLLKASKNDLGKSLIVDADNLLLRKQFLRTQAQLAFLVDKLFSGQIPDFIIKLEDNDFLDCGVISDKLQVTYITVEEYEEIQWELNDITVQCKELKEKCSYLEEINKIAQDEAKSLQKLLSEITDNHIDLRHLLADLQSTDETKFLISKSHRDLELAKNEMNKLKDENEQLDRVCLKLKDMINDSDENIEKITKSYKDQINNYEIKLRFFEKSIIILKEKFCKYTPLVHLTNFLSLYSKYLNERKQEDDTYGQVLKDLENVLSSKLQSNGIKVQSQEVINLVKYETKCNFLEKQLTSYAKRIEILQGELNDCKILQAEETEHWRTIEALFGHGNMKIEYATKGIQCVTEQTSISTNTEENFEENITEKKDEKEILSPQLGTPTKSPIKIIPDAKKDLEISSPSRQFGTDSKTINIVSLESQLKQAMNLASMRSSLLLETENRLAEAQGRIKEMEKIIEGKKQLLKQEHEKTSTVEEKALQKSSNIIETTISSLQSLLTEKHNTLVHYQELLKTEREQHTKSCDNYEKELNSLKKTIIKLETDIRAKEIENFEFKSKVDVDGSQKNSMGDENILDDDFDNLDKDVKNLNDMSDEKIEEMFLDESKHGTPKIVVVESSSTVVESDEILNKQIQQMQNQIQEHKNRDVFWEKSLRAKDEEILVLKERLNSLQEKEKLDTNSAEIDQLKILLEEKDKHISDLMETLTSFHDDQQGFINATSLYSADQMTQLAADLNRSENTNKILNAQLEALRRQIGNLTQREKQARDLVNSLKTQLIKRPVIPIKHETSRKSTEQLQKRITQLEAELDEARQQIKRQQNIIDAKKAKNSTEISLWEKQKRWQQNAEKFKTKLTETEAILEKTKSMLNSARVTVEKLEREKHSLEVKLRNTQQQQQQQGHVNKCCRTPSCPNLLAKYGPSETPDSMATTGPSEIDSPSRRHNIRVHFYNNNSSQQLLSDPIENSNRDLYNALKASIDAEEKKIVALESEENGSRTLISEVEKLQEKVSTLEAENIRLEGKNLKLQLDNNMLQQGDEVERLKKKIKYLEEYIIALKEEIARMETQKITNASQSESKSFSQPEQTILALKRIVEKLRVENKNLKEGRKHYEPRNIDSRDGSSSSEISRLQQLYAEALDKISALQIELQLKAGCCSLCREKSTSNLEGAGSGGAGDLVNELKFIKDQLRKKTHLLEKAKILLARAAAKEKHLKEQLAAWKRKCSELQNVPVIDEISE